MDLVREFSRLGKGDAALAGGKGASLGEMTRAGIPVPPGFVVLSSVFDRFVKETGLTPPIRAELDRVNPEELETVERASERIKTLILGKEMPRDIATAVTKSFRTLKSEYVAVRSSATAEDSASAAWAGQLESYLNTTEKTLMQNVQKCWASLFTPRAIVYRFEKGLSETRISVAVVVQRMVASEVSGIAFSVHPVTQDRNQIIIEAGIGLGEAIVSGQVTPDSYVIDKRDWSLIEKKAHEQTRAMVRGPDGGVTWEEVDGKAQKLADSQITSLAKLIARIENHYGFPCDIEWAMEDGKTYIVQSRPITTLTKASDNREATIVQEPWVKEWERGAKVQKATDYSRSGDGPFEERFGLGMKQWLYVLDGKGASAIYHRERERSEFLDYYLKKFQEDERFLDDIHRFEDLYETHLAFLRENICKDLGSLSDKGLIKLFVEYKKSLMTFFVYLWTAITWEKAIERTLHEALKRNFRPRDIEKAALTILSPTTENYLLQEELDLIRIKDAPKARRAVLLDEHIEKYKYIPMYDYDHEPYHRAHFEKRLAEIDPTVVKAKRDCVQQNKRALDKTLSSKNISAHDKRILLALHSLFNQKDQRSHYRSMESFFARGLYEEIGRRRGVTLKDLMFLTDNETIGVLDGSIAIASIPIAERARGNAFVYEDGDVRVLVGKEMDEYLKANLQANEEGELRGLIIGTGRATGKVCIVRNTEDLNAIADGCVLVTSMTRPEYVTAMKRCVAIVTDEGSMLCHAAIVSRELGIPCVVGTKVATQVLKDGMMVEVDANTGVVRILDKKSQNEMTLADKFIEEIGNQELRPPIYNSSMLVHRSGWHTEKYFGRHYDDKTPYPLLLLLSREEGILYLPVTKEKELAKEMFRRFWKDRSVITKRLRQFRKRAIDVSERVDRLSYRRLREEPLKRILKELEGLANATWEMSAAVFFSIYFDRKVCEELLAEHGVTIDDFDGIWKRATAPVGISFEKKRELRLLDLIAKRRPWKEIAESCQHFLTAYDKVEPAEAMEKRLKEEYGTLTPVLAKRRLEGELRKAKRRQAEHSRWLTTLKAEERKVVEFTQSLIELRDSRKDIIMKGVTGFYRVGERVFEEAGLPKELIFFVSTEEIAKGLQYLDEKREEIARRPDGVALLVHYDGRQEMAYGDVAINKEIVNSHYLSQNTMTTKDGIEGQPGSSGKVRGVARVIQNLKRERERMRKGDILVTGMTRPEFVPLMKIASGIVTDEGGVTCHAAIVSRELKIPCVVGTKVATRIIKDGDLVEVDADKGVVRIVDDQKTGSSESEIEFTREMPISLFHIWAWGQERAFRILGMGAAPARAVYAEYDHGVAKGYTQKGNIEKIKAAIAKQSPKALSGILKRYEKGFGGLRNDKKRVLDKEALISLVGDFVIAFVLGDMPEHALQKEALRLRKKTEKLFYMLWELLKKGFVDEANFDSYTYDEVLAGKQLSKDEISRRRTCVVRFDRIDASASVTKTVLSRIYAREKPLVYLCMWDESDRLGYKRFLKHDVRHNLFIMPPAGKKSTVWYDKEELRIIEDLTREAARSKRTVKELSDTLERGWKRIAPYLLGKRLLSDIEALSGYYDALVAWWSAMNTSFIIPDLEGVPVTAKKLFLKHRLNSEKHTQAMSDVMVEFWEREFPKHKTLSHVLTPNEMIGIANGRIAADGFGPRLKGCFMLDGTVHPMEDLERALAENGITLEEEEEKSDVRGTPAYKGVAKGIVRIVHGFVDLDKVRPGDVLVTEMTNPKYLPALKKAAAFVTDEGGMTCHAAIVARELKKPCIVGTKNSTRILKDGDMVEVDADEGVVRIVGKDDSTSLPEYFTRMERFGTRPMTVQRDELLREMQWPHKVNVASLPLNDASREVYVESAPERECYRRLLQGIRTEKGWRKHLSEYGPAMKELEKASRAVTRITEDKMAIATAYRRWMRAYVRVTPYVLMPFPIERVLDPEFRSLMREGFGEDADRIISGISSPSELHDFQRMRLAIIDVALSKDHGQEDYEKLAADWGWYNEYSYVEPLLDASHFEHEVAQLTRASAQAEWKKMTEELERNGKEFTAAMKRIKDPAMQVMAAVIHKYTFLRTDRIDRLKRAQVALRTLFRQVATALMGETGAKWDVPLIASCTADEILNYLEHGTVPDIRHARIRLTQQYLYYTIDGKPRILHDKESIERARSMIVGSHTSTSIKGLIAHRGKAKGKVALVLGKHDLKKVRPGDILVARTTMPDYAPAMTIASAFVTEEGGITSHAAIIARELKKPCIVGTGNCTQVLKDGMTVEVDADKGIVTILQNQTKEYIVPRVRKIDLSPSYWNGLVHTGDAIERVYGRRLGEKYLRYHDGMGWFVDPKGDAEEIGEAVSTRLLEEGGFFESVSRLTATAKRQALSLIRVYARVDLRKRPLHQLMDDAQKIREAFMQYDTATVFSWWLAGEPLKRKVGEKLGVSGEDLDILSLPDEKTFATRMERDVLVRALGKGSASRIAKDLMKAYYWIPFGYDGPTTWGEGHFEKLIDAARASKAVTRRKLVEMTRREREITRRKAAIAREGSFGKMEDRLIDVLRTVGSWTDERKMLDFQLFYHYTRVLSELERRSGVGVADLKYVLTEELPDLEKDAERIRKLAKERRSGDVILVFDRGTVRFADAKQRETVMETVRSHETGDDIKGVVACKGSKATYVAVARVLQSSRDCARVGTGEIIVTSMTTPDYLPAMGRALGFITDEGGVTCHAAIVARELKKPCIIGTRRATRLLEDGARVEMDMETGVVRILN